MDAHVLLVHGGEHCRHRLFHQTRDAFVRIGDDQVIQRNGAQKAAAAVDHEHGVEVLHFPPLTTDLLESLGRRE